MTLEVAVVADDLTGALDAAAPFAGRGLATRVACAPEALEAALAARPEVLAVNAATRHVSAPVAAEVTRSLVAQLDALAPRLLFKKIDSTLRGNVVAEVAAAVRACGRRAAVCPAVSAQGRSVRGGELLVDGRPLAAPEDGRVPGPGLADRLRAGLADVRSVPRGAAWPPDGHLVLDAESEADLTALARMLNGESPRWLPVGASGLTAALAEVRFGPARERWGTAGPGPALFVVGSRAARARAQLVRLRERRPRVSLVEAPAGRVPRAAPPDADVIAVSVDDREHDPDRVAAALGRGIRRLLEGRRPRVLVLTGGDTALSVLDALGIGELRVAGEVRPGVVEARASWRGGVLPVVTKAGGFGEADLFLELLEAFPRLDDDRETV